LPRACSTIPSKILNDPRDIKDIFGEEIAFLVDSLTKLSKIEFKTRKRHRQRTSGDASRMSEDIRVIIIKFADRLHI